MKQQQPYRIVVFLTCMMALTMSVMGGYAAANEVYSWTDEQGIVHYTDLPPDGQKADTINVSESPDSSATLADPTPVEAQPDAVSDADGQETSPPQSYADARREKIARDRKERREKQAEMDRMCAQHRQRFESIAPHRRVIYKDENGVSVRMDDDKRIALVEESRDFIAENCD